MTRRYSIQQRALAEKIAAGVEDDCPDEAGFERRRGLIHVLPVEVHAGFKPQGIARAEPAWPNARGKQLFPDAFELTGRQYQLKTILAGVAGASDKIFTAPSRVERFEHSGGL